MPFSRCRSPSRSHSHSHSRSHSRSRSRSRHTRFFEEICESSSSDSEVCIKDCDCNYCFPVFVPAELPRRRPSFFGRAGPFVQQNVSNETINVFAGRTSILRGAPTCVVIDSDDSGEDSNDDDTDTKPDFPRIHGSDWDRGRPRHIQKLSDYRVIENEDGRREVYNVNQFFKNRLAADEAAKQKQKEAAVAAARSKKHVEDMGHLERMYAHARLGNAVPCGVGHRSEEDIRRDIAKCDAKLERLHQDTAAQARRRADRNHWEVVNNQDVFCHGALLGEKKARAPKRKVEPNIQSFSQREEGFKGRHFRRGRHWK